MESTVVGLLDCSQERRYDGWDELCDEPCNVNFESQEDIEPRWLVRVKVSSDAVVCHDIRSLVHFLQMKNKEPYTLKKFTQTQLDTLTDMYLRKCWENEGQRPRDPRLSVDTEQKMSVNELRHQMHMPLIAGGGDVAASPIPPQRGGMLRSTDRFSSSLRFVVPRGFAQWDYRTNEQPSVLDGMRLARTVGFPMTTDVQQTGERVRVFYQAAKRMFVAHIARFGPSPVHTWPFFWFVFLRISARKMREALDVGALDTEIAPTLEEMSLCFAAAHEALDREEGLRELLAVNTWREEDQEEFGQSTGSQWQFNDPSFAVPPDERQRIEAAALVQLVQRDRR